MHLHLAGNFTTYDPNVKEPKELYAFYSNVFSKADRIGCIRMPPRHIGYECCTDERRNLVFIGFEVEKPGAVPEGLVLLSIGDTHMTLREQTSPGVFSTKEIPMRWRWRDSLSVHGQDWGVGELLVDIKELFGVEECGTRELWMNFNVFGTGPIEGGDRIEIVDYRDSWPGEFDSFRTLLTSHFPSDLFTRIEHIGSTAVPGLPAKPIIDLLVEVPSFAQAREKIIPLLDDQSWEYCWFNRHFMLIKREKYKGVRTHHVHVVTKDHEQWRCVAFRDHLRANPRKVREYAALKRQLATEFPGDRERYTWAKADFITATTDEAIRMLSREDG